MDRISRTRYQGENLGSNSNERNYKADYICVLGFPGGSDSKQSACNARELQVTQINPQVGKIPWSRKWQPTPVFLLGKSHGLWSLVGYSPWSCKTDTTKATKPQQNHL